MGIKTNLYKPLFAACAFLLATVAHAEVPTLEPLNYSLRYDVDWSGLPIGRIRVKFVEDQFGYRMTVDTKTGGIARLFSSEKSVAKVEGRRIGGSYVPTSYSSSNRGDSVRTTSITYDEYGHIVALDRKPMDKPSRRAPVSREDANTATDPVTAFFTLRHQLHAAMKVNQREASTRTYEGARLAEMKIRVVSPAKVEVRGKHEQAINTLITRKLINGYTEKEKKKYAEGDPPIHIFFSADGRFMPLKISIGLPMGQVSAVLAEIK